MRARVGWVVPIKKCNSILGTNFYGNNDYVVLGLAGMRGIGCTNLAHAMRRLGPMRAIYFVEHGSREEFPPYLEPESSSDEGDDQGSSLKHRKRKLPRSWEGEPLGRGRPFPRDGGVHESDPEEPEVLSDSESDGGRQDSQSEDRESCAECGEYVELCHQGGPSSSPDGRTSQWPEAVKRRRTERGVRPSVHPRYDGVRGIGYASSVLGEPIRPSDPLRYDRAGVDRPSGTDDEAENSRATALGLPPSPLRPRRMAKSIPKRTDGSGEDAVREGFVAKCDDSVPHGPTQDC